MKNVDEIKKRIADLQAEIRKIETEKKAKIGAEFMKSFDAKTEITGSDILSFFEKLKELNLFNGNIKLTAAKPESKPETEVKSYVSL